MSLANEHSKSALRIAHFQAWHTYWSGWLDFYNDGRFVRPGVDEGSYEWEPRQQLTLRWDRWEPECLQWQPDSKTYVDRDSAFCVREVPAVPKKWSAAENSVSVRPQRMVVGAFSCLLPQYQNRRQACLESWIPALESQGVEVLFLVGVGDVVSEPVVVESQIHGRLGTELWLPCPDDYESLPQKTNWFCRWALVNRIFDYLFKCDDDTYVVPRRLLSVITSDDDYVGYDLTCDAWHHFGSYASGGAGYFLSRRAAARVAAHVTAKTGYEDVEVGRTLRDAGMLLRHDDRLIPIGNEHERRPRRDNALVTSHACAAVFDLHDSTWEKDPLAFCGAESPLVDTGILKVAFLVIATDRYAEFLDSLLGQAREHFFPGHQRTFFVFSDQPIEGDDVVWIETEHRSWPEITLHKSQILLQAEKQLREFDFLLLCDADMEIVGEIGPEMIGDLVAARHAGFCERPRSEFTYETDRQSLAAVSAAEGDMYYMASVEGGRPPAFLAAHREMAAKIECDYQEGRVAVWQDESYWNRYLIDHPPDTVLPACYCWSTDRHHPSPKIRVIEKDHAQFRRYEESFVTFSRLGQYGRLGNQLFQYAMLLSVAKHQGCEVAIPRNALMGFSVSAKRLKRQELLAFSRSYKEPGEPFDYNDEVIQQSVGTDFLGYFQNHRYFESVSELVRREFQATDSLSDAAARIVADVRRFAAGREVVFLGVRRGDYVSSNGFHRPFEKDYFDRARTHFADDVIFMVSSDNLDWARAELTGDAFYFLEVADPVVKLCAASQADHWICSASTYHWWAAWLGRVPGSGELGKVIVPSPWYGPNYPGDRVADEMCPPDWIRQA